MPASFVEQGGLEHARQRELEELLERERRSRAETAIAEATAGLDTDESSFHVRWSTENSTFADLLHSIVKAWR